MRFSRIRLSLLIRHHAIEIHIILRNQIKLLSSAENVPDFPVTVLSDFLCKRLPLFLNQHTTGRAPLLHGHYPASSLLRAPPTPHRQSMRFILPHPLLSHDLQSMGSPKFRVKLSSRAIRYHPEEPNRCTHPSLPCSCRVATPCGHCFLSESLASRHHS